MGALKEALKDKAEGNASRAALALGRIGEPAIPALIEAMSHPNAGTRAQAVLGLRQLGPKARKAIPALAGALQDSDDWVRCHACWALGDMGAEAKEASLALRALRQRLKERSERICSSSTPPRRCC